MRVSAEVVLDGEDSEPGSDRSEETEGETAHIRADDRNTDFSLYLDSCSCLILMLISLEELFHQ